MRQPASEDSINARLLPCAEQHRSGLLGALLGDLARFGRLCPARNSPELRLRGPAIPLPILTLPMPLLACVIGHAGLSAMCFSALASTRAYQQLWENPLLWRAVLHALGAPDASLRAAGLDDACQQLREPCAKAFRAHARHWLFSIDLLINASPQVKSAHSPSATILDARRAKEAPQRLDLAEAARAVLALQLDDGELLIQRATESLVQLLQWRSAGTEELAKAEALLEAVAERSDLFNVSQMLSILGAHQEKALSSPRLDYQMELPWHQQTLMH